MTERFGKKQSELQRWYLKDWRKHRGLTQEQLADAIDSAKPTISRMENGQIPYNQPFLEACAEVLNCRPSDLLAAAPDEADSSIVAEIQNKLKTMNELQLKKVLQIVELMNE